MMSNMAMNENLETMIARFQDQEFNEIHVEALEELTDFILDHSADNGKTIGMLNCVRTMRSLVMEIGRAANGNEDS